MTPTEFIFYQNNPIDFIKKYFNFFSDPMYGRINTQMPEFEEEALKYLFKYNQVFINKHRQVYLSTIMCKYLAYKLIFSRNVIAYYIGNINAKNKILEYISVMLHSEYLVYDVGKIDRLRINGNYIRFLKQVNENFGCGEKITDLFFDEIPSEIPSKSKFSTIIHNIIPSLVSTKNYQFVIAVTREWHENHIFLYDKSNWKKIDIQRDRYGIYLTPDPNELILITEISSPKLYGEKYFANSNYQQNEYLL